MPGRGSDGAVAPGAGGGWARELLSGSRWPAGLAVGLLNGLLGAGATLLVPVLAYGVRLERRRAHGTALPVILAASLVSIGVYATSGQVPGSFAGWVAAGGAIGGAIGARLVGHVGGRHLRLLFGLAMLVAAWRMVAG